MTNGKPPIVSVTIANHLLYGIALLHPMTVRMMILIINVNSAKKSGGLTGRIIERRTLQQAITLPRERIRHGAYLRTTTHRCGDHNSSDVH